MSKVKINNIIVNPEPEPFESPIRLKIYPELLSPIKEQIEVKVIYVGSASDSSYDQILDNVLIPLSEVGCFEFDLNVTAPDYSKIPTIDLLGPSALMICVFYKKNEFFRCSYFLNNNDITRGEDNNGFDESNFNINNVYRCILAKKPRIKLYDIDWTDIDYESIGLKINKEEINELTKVNDELLMEFGDPFAIAEDSFLNR